MLKALEIGIGIVLGFGVVAGVFWFTFRNPPPMDRDASDRLNSGGQIDVGALYGGHDGSHGA